jgi:hypothetical protein
MKYVEAVSDFTHCNPKESNLGIEYSFVFHFYSRPLEIVGMDKWTVHGS